MGTPTTAPARGEESDTGALAPLRRIRERPRQPAGQGCELCGATVPGDHRHVVDVTERRLLCACRPCGLLFARDGAAAGRYRAVPEQVVRIHGFTLRSGQWDALQIPVTTAFFLTRSASDGVAAFYPSPAGATESLLGLGAWEEIAAGNPAVRGARPDVEAVLVRAGPGAPEAFIVPVDACYELVGHLRRLWKGFDGGTEVRDGMAGFFAALGERAARVRRG